MNTEFESPLRFPPQKVLPEWIDFNGHMNVAYYVMAFDHCVDILFNRLGIGPKQLVETQRSVFVMEAHINYIREVVKGDLLQVTGRLVDYDEKRIRYYLEMHHGSEHYLIATLEQLGVHVDLKQRKSIPMSKQILTLLDGMAEAHRKLPSTKYLGRRVGIPKKMIERK